MKNTLGSKVLRIYFISCLAVIFVSVVGIAILTNHVYKEQMIDFCENTVNLNLNIINNELLSLQESQRLLASDEQIKQIIKYRINNNQPDYSIELYNQRAVFNKFDNMLRTAQIKNAYIMTTEGECIYWFTNYVNGELLKKQEWYKDIICDMKMNISYISEIHNQEYLLNQSQDSCISMIMPILLKNSTKLAFKPKAYLIYDIDLKSILNIECSQIDFAFWGQNNNIHFFDSDYKNSNEIKNYILKSDLSNNVSVLNINNISDEDLLVVSMKTDFFNFRLIGIKRLTENEAIQNQVISLSIIIISLAMLFTVPATHKTVTLFVKPMNRLMENCREISNGNYNIQFENEKIEEIKVFSQTIQGMITSIVTLNQRAIDEEKRYFEQKLIALQHQINPHFINNVLQSIKGLALLGENVKISKIATSLGRVMAYSVYKPYQMVTLKDEFEHIKNYLHVQSIRYDGKIHYSLEYTKDVEYTSLLKLTLQPIVENSVEHGIKSNFNIFITITADCEDNDIFIIIHDNGNGISQEKLSDINNMLFSGKTYEQENSVGIINVNARIKKKFGNDYGVELISNKGNGTTVIVKIPRN